MKYLLHGCRVVTMNARRDILDADILVDGDRIAALGPDIAVLPEARDAERVDMTGRVLLPGLIQAHMHVTQILFRGLCDDLELMDWLEKRTWPLEGAHSAASNAVSARLAALELIRSGTTSLVDMGTIRHEDAIFEVMEAVGLRGLFGKCMMDEGAGVPASMRESAEDSLRETERLIRKWHMRGGGRLRCAVAPRFIPSCSDALLTSARDLARANGLRLHTHASENMGEIALVEGSRRMRNILYLHKLGYTGEDVLLAHCVWLDGEEKRVLADTGTHVVHCPSSNTKMSSGFAPVAELRDMGVNVALGLDGAHNHMDSFLEMRQASVLQKALLNNPLALPAPEALEIATLGGARAMGQEAEIGSLEVGKKADLIALNLEMPHTLPAVGRDVVGRIVYEATRENVTDSMVDGRFLYRAGKFLTLDAGAVLRDAERECLGCICRAGLEFGTRPENAVQRPILPSRQVTS
ncbi:MAG TPA: 5'-deoxyadenosine deaminase [Candidatus Mailhella excrementigallinarum]|nr:MAG: N-ethylammeline chlorohydrolase [Desulfovibrionaceae bacterium]HIV65586.1 5'-deoxyadenosine deaminase [Candidatus Mailhella excrementigallinarum]